MIWVHVGQQEGVPMTGPKRPAPLHLGENVRGVNDIAWYVERPGKMAKVEKLEAMENCSEKMNFHHERRLLDALFRPRQRIVIAIRT